MRTQWRVWKELRRHGGEPMHDSADRVHRRIYGELVSAIEEGDGTIKAGSFVTLSRSAAGSSTSRLGSGWMNPTAAEAFELVAALFRAQRRSGLA